MPTQWQTIAVPFLGGVDTKTDSRSLTPPKLAVVENGVFDKRGSILKRNGYTRLDNLTSDGTNRITSGQSLFTRKNELLLADGEHLWSWQESQSKWYSRGAYVPLAIATAGVCERQSNQQAADYDEAGGVGVYAWQDSRGGIRYSIIDVESGDYLYSDQAIASTTACPRVIAIDGYIHILYIDTGAGSLSSKIIRPAALASSISSTPSQHVTDIRTASNVCYDACIYGTSARVAYVKSNNTDVCVFKLSKGGTAGSVTTFAITATSLALAATAEDAPFPHLLLACGTAATLSVTYMDPETPFGNNATETVAATPKRVAISQAKWAGAIERESTTVDYGDSAYFTIWVETSGATDRDSYVKTYAWSDYATLSGTVGATIQHACLSSGGFRVGNYGYAVLSYVDTVQPTYLVYRSDGKCVGKALPGTAGGVPGATLGPTICTTPKATTAGISWAGVNRKSLETVPTTNASGVVTGLNISRADYGITRIDLDFSVTTAGVEVGGSLYLTGGMLYQYDGHTVTESGFTVYPESVTTSHANSTGALTLLGTYAYRIYYEWTNAQGERERSAALPCVVTLTTDHDTVTLTIPTLSHTSKTDVSIVIYRTEANPTFDSAFYRVSDPSPAVSGSNGYKANDTTTATVTFTDELADSSITSNEIDYQSSGELENIAAPSPRIICQGQSRIFIASDDERTVYYSKLAFAGSLVAFSDALTIDVGAGGGPITGLAMLNEQLVVFKRDSIYVVQGAGPNNLGVGSFAPTAIASSDVGCTDARSIVLIPSGLMFGSEKGIRLVDQGFQIQYIGAEVEAYRAQSITSAQIVDDRNQVRFLTDDGVTLLYDYQFSQWSTWTNHEGVAAARWKAATYCYLTAGGRVMVEADGVYSDAGVEIRRVLETGWISLRGLQGYQSVRRLGILGTYKSPHRLRVHVYKNGEVRPSYSYEWDPSSALGIDPYGSGAYGAGAFGGSGSTEYRHRHHIRGSLKCSGIKIRIEDIPELPPGESCVLTELMLEVGTRGGVARTPAAKEA